MKPLISVYVVTFNQEKYIAECLDSILEQNGDFSLEIIVADDCSTDRTPEIVRKYCESFPNSVRAILQDKNVGPNRNITDVLTACNGKYIAHMDGDDLMLPNKLQKQVEVLESNNDIAVVCHNMRVFEDSDPNNFYLYNKKSLNTIRDFNDVLKYGSMFCNSSNMFRASCLEKQPVYLPVKVVGDWLFHMQKLRSGKVFFINETLGCYRRNEGSVVRINQKNIQLIMDDLLLTLDVVKNYPEVDPDAHSYAVSRVLQERALRFLELGEFSKFKQLIELSFEKYKTTLTQFLLYKFRYLSPVLKISFRCLRIVHKKRA